MSGQLGYMSMARYWKCITKAITETLWNSLHLPTLGFWEAAWLTGQREEADPVQAALWGWPGEDKDWWETAGGREPKAGAAANGCHLPRRRGKELPKPKQVKKIQTINNKCRTSIFLVSEPPKEMSLIFWLFSTVSLFSEDMWMVGPILGLPVRSASSYQESITSSELWTHPFSLI